MKILMVITSHDQLGNTGGDHGCIHRSHRHRACTKSSAADSRVSQHVPNQARLPLQSDDCGWLAQWQSISFTPNYGRFWWPNKFHL